MTHFQTLSCLWPLDPSGLKLQPKISLTKNTKWLHASHTSGQWQTALKWIKNKYRSFSARHKNFPSHFQIRHNDKPLIEVENILIPHSYALNHRDGKPHIHLKENNISQLYSNHWAISDPTGRTPLGFGNKKAPMHNWAGKCHWRHRSFPVLLESGGTSAKQARHQLNYFRKAPQFLA
jgi:hypothetical protein